MASRHITIQFGLVTIAAKSAVAIERAPEFKTLCVGQPGKDAHPPSPKRMPSVCETCGPITDNDVLVKGVKQGTTYVLVDAAQIAAVKESYGAEYKGVINLVPHPAEEFFAGTAQGDSLHFLTPADTAGEGHYQLLVRLIAEHPELAFAGLFTPESATSLYVVRVREGVLVMEKRTRGEAMKATPSVGGEVNDALYAMLDGALSTFVTPFDPSEYEDTYTRTVGELIAAGEQVSVGATETTTTSVVSDDDLIAKLAKLKAVA